MDDSGSARARRRHTARPGHTPFRFYDNRQKYLAFVTTCNEKSAIARRAAQELPHLRPSPPAIRVFDAGMGDATVLSRLMRSIHDAYPTAPLFVVAKEISLEDVRLGLDKLPDRFHEHPATIFVVTNLHYADAPRLLPHERKTAAALDWHEIRLVGDSAHAWSEQIEALAPILNTGWQTRSSPATGNPVYVRPSVLVIYRDDHAFLLDAIIPKRGSAAGAYDFVLASQPWRARTSAGFKARTVLAPLARALAPDGRLLAIQSYGRDPGLEIVRRLWPGENPFRVGRRQLVAALRAELGADAREFRLTVPTDAQSIFRYEMHTLPSQMGDRIGTSTLYAAWNAAIYVNQIEDERLDEVMTSGKYLEATQAVLRTHGGLWFNDETFVVTRRVVRR